MTTDSFAILRSGFDTLELAYGAALPEAFLDVLESTKQQAAKSRHAEPVSYRGVEFLVEASGAQGGYAYRVSTGQFGAILTIRDKASRDQWTTHAKLRAHGLAAKGIRKAKADCDDFLTHVGGVFDPNDVRVSRADFAIDVYYPSFILRTAEFITHARTLHSEVIDRRGNSETCNYVRFGKLPGKQLCVYAKGKKVIGENDLIWIEILRAKLQERSFAETHLRDVWRFELRAGKNFISDRIGLRRWDKITPVLSELFLPILNSISMRLPSSDNNRSRWSLHPLWLTIAEVIRNQIHVDPPTSIHPAVLARLRENHLAGLDAQHLGLIITRAALDGVDATGVASYVPKLVSRLTSDLVARPDLSEDLARRRRRAELQYGCS